MSQAALRVKKEINQLSRIEELEQKERYLKILNSFAISLISKHTVTEITWDVVRSVIVHMGFEDCVIYIIDRSRNKLVQYAAHGAKNPKDNDIKNPIIISKGNGIVGSVALTGIAEIVNDTSLDPRYILDDERRYSEITVPIISEGEVIGIIDSEHTQKSFFTQTHLDILTTVSSMVADKIKRAWLEKELQEHRDSLEETVVQRTNQLEESLKSIREINDDLLSFSYATSHDLKEPLRMIVSFLQLIRIREKSLSPESNQNIDFILSSAFRMQRLLDELLSYSRVNFQDEDRRSLSFNSILSSAKKNLSLLIENSNTEILIENDVPGVFGHELLLIQLFQNLISNSIKFGREGVAPIINIGYVKKGHYDTFRFRDNGIGVPEQFRSKIFKLFQRLDGSNKGGSGIGLAFCQRIIDKHQGYIKIIDEAEGDIGTTFEFGLPRVSHELIDLNSELGSEHRCKR